LPEIGGANPQRLSGAGTNAAFASENAMGAPPIRVGSLEANPRASSRMSG